MHALKAPGLQRVGTAVMALGVALLLAFASIVWGGQAAQAATYPNAITSVSTSQSTYPHGGEIDLSFEWSLPHGAKSGETFEVTLPAELIPSNTVTFPLREGSNIVGIATWNGSTVTVELQPYVDGLANVSGTLEFSAQLVANGSTEETSLVLDFGGGITTTVVMEGQDDTVHPAPTGQNGDKFGYFVRPDKGTIVPEGALQWGIQIPSRAEGYEGPIMVRDAVRPGHTLDTASIEVTAFRYTNPDDSSQIEYVSPFAQGERWKLIAEDTGGYLIEIDEVRGATGTTSAEFINVYYTTSVDNSQQQEYGNQVTITVPNNDDVVKSYSVDRISGGGTGGGIVTDPAILLKKWSAKDGSIAAGDHNEIPKMLEVNTPEELIMTITNEGDEPLIGVAVEDITVEGPAATGLSCDFSPLGGPATGLYWDGPFAVGAQFECSATVPGMAADTVHTNQATVTALGAVSGKPVTSSDPWTGKTVPPAPEPTPPAPTEPTPPVPTEPTPPAPGTSPPASDSASSSTRLPRTGADVAGLGAFGGLLVAFGATALLVGMRRRSRA